MFLFSNTQAAGLNEKTKVLWVGQYVNNSSVFFFSSEYKDSACASTATSGIYRVEGSNSKSIYSALLASASSGKYISFSTSGCDVNNRAIINEVYYWAN